MLKNKILILLLLFFGIRLIGILNPPIENGHNWRQTTGLMVSRNFLEINSNIFFPRVDDTNGGTGIIGMEFPIMNYCVFLLYKIFGFHDWFGRMLNLIVSSIGIFYFYRSIKKYFNPDLAFYSSLLLLSSIWFQFSRKMMPDTFCISIMMVAVYYGLNYFYDKKNKYFIPYLLFSSLAILCKIPAGIYFGIFIIPMLDKKIELKNKILFSVLSLIPIITMYYWYFIWNPYLATIDHNWYNSGGSIINGIKDISNNLSQFFSRFYFNSFYSYTFFIVFLLGLIQIIKQKNKLMLGIFLSISLLFTVYILKSGFFFFHHNYYIIPIVPLFSFIAGYWLTLIRNKKYICFILVIGCTEAIINQQHDLFQGKDKKYKMELESIFNKFSKRNELIAVVGNGNPQELYLAHRRGWSIYLKDFNDKNKIEKLRKENCKWILINKEENQNRSNDFLSPYFSNEHYIIYSLNQF